MVSLNDMAEAHLKNVQAKIDEFRAQQAQIEQEITRLSTYLQECIEELNQTKPAEKVNPSIEPVNFGSTFK